MNLRLYPVKNNIKVNTNFDEIGIKHIDVAILNLEREFEENSKNYNYLKNTKEENELRNEQIARYKDTLDALIEIRKDLYKYKDITNNEKIRNINNLKELQGMTPVKITIGDDIESEEISTWSGVVVFISEYLIKKNKDMFEEIAVTIKGRTRNYFSYDSEKLYKAKQIKNTELKCEGNNSADIQANICRELLEKMQIQEEVIIEVK